MYVLTSGMNPILIFQTRATAPDSPLSGKEKTMKPVLTTLLFIVLFMGCSRDIYGTHIQHPRNSYVC